MFETEFRNKEDKIAYELWWKNIEDYDTSYLSFY